MKQFKYKVYDIMVNQTKVTTGIAAKLKLTIMHKNDFELTLWCPKTPSHGYFGIGATREEAFKALISGLKKCGILVKWHPPRPKEWMGL